MEIKEFMKDHQFDDEKPNRRPLLVQLSVVLLVIVGIIYVQPLRIKTIPFRNVGIIQSENGTFRLEPEGMILLKTNSEKMMSIPLSMQNVSYEIPVMTQDGYVGFLEVELVYLIEEENLSELHKILDFNQNSIEDIWLKHKIEFSVRDVVRTYSRNRIESNLSNQNFDSEILSKVNTEVGKYMDVLSISVNKK